MDSLGIGLFLLHSTTKIIIQAISQNGANDLKRRGKFPEWHESVSLLKVEIGAEFVCLVDPFNK